MWFETEFREKVSLSCVTPRSQVTMYKVPVPTSYKRAEAFGLGRCTQTANLQQQTFVLLS